MKASLDNLRAKVLKNTTSKKENIVQINIGFAESFEDMKLNNQNVLSFESAKMIVKMLKLSNVQLRQDDGFGITKEWDNF